MSLGSYDFFFKALMSSQTTQAYVFGRFRIDAGKRLLFAKDELVALTPKAFDTLLALVENRGTVLSKEELMSLVWADQFVEENNLAQNIHLIRKSLGEGSEGVKYIETIPKRGYRFVADVEVLTEPPPAATRPKTQYATSTGGVNIAYQVIGEGPLDLVFVMGWVSHLEYSWQEPSFARFLTRLASFSRLILFDKRGTGLSDAVPLSELPTLEQRVTDVQAVMDAVGSERAALLGVSEGGPMCGLFAATHPERTEALVMIGSYAKRLWAEDYPWGPTEREREEFRNEMKRSWGGPIGIEERAPSMAGDPQFREWWAAYLRMGASPAAALALTQMNAEVDVRSVLPSIRVPSLVIHRRDDACLPVEGGRFIASLIPGAKYVELEGKDHLPFAGDQDEILDEIEEFLTGARICAGVERLFDRVLTTVLFVLFDAPTAAAYVNGRREIKGLHKYYARRELALFRGKEIEMTNGHLFATFDGPARAIRCALAIADAAARLGMRARAGLHTGECDVTGKTIGGLTVKLGESVAGLASFGEVLISHTVKDLVAGSGIEFEPRGAHALESLPGEWRLFAVARGVNH
jgi:pimeloyl-ACP methyl ester carboxylesterase/DNA-binding winged helix-turn-helix (wHTH) protein/class 3 adenylate cyclase